MKLLVTILIVATVNADKLRSNYLPPDSARTAGGSNFLVAPNREYVPPAPAFTRTGAPTSYAAPASGPVPSGLYNAPATRTYSANHYSGNHGTPSAILKYNNDNNGEGSYRFEYETENRIFQQEEGHLENAGTDHEANVVHGTYSYTSPEGQLISVSYVADELGFRPVGDHIPTPPPIPVAIQRSLEINAAAERTNGYSSDNSYSISRGYQKPISRQYLEPRANDGYRY